MSPATVSRHGRIRRLLAPLAALLTMTLIGAAFVYAQIQPSRAAAEQASHDHNHYVFFDASPGGKQLAPAVDAASGDDGSRLVSWDYSGPDVSVTHNSVFWWGAEHSAGAGYKRLHAEHSGKCLGTDDGQVIQRTCDDQADSWWSMTDEAGGKGKLKNRATGQCMHLGWGNGDPVVLGPCEGERSLVTIATSGDEPASTSMHWYLRWFIHDGPGLAEASQRAAGIAQRELEREQAGNEHAGRYLCNFYSGKMNGPSARCRLAGHSSWGSGNWCADFVRYTWAQAGRIDMADLDGLAESFKTYGIRYMTWHEAGSGYVPRPGDAVVFHDADNNGKADHVGVVHERLDNGDVYVISGNAGPGEVRRTLLDWSKVQGLTTPRLDI